MGTFHFFISCPQWGHSGASLDVISFFPLNKSLPLLPDDLYIKKA
jgi:hypothetical protein